MGDQYLVDSMGSVQIYIYLQQQTAYNDVLNDDVSGDVSSDVSNPLELGGKIHRVLLQVQGWDVSILQPLVPH